LSISGRNTNSYGDGDGCGSSASRALCFAFGLAAALINDRSRFLGLDVNARCTPDVHMSGVISMELKAEFLNK
jgi:hypothetical protein